MSKVFGIGLSRTGTWSLTMALRILGYKAIHFPKIEENIVTSNYNFANLGDFDALTDTPIVPIFQNLDLQYPNSKFILTIREKEDWLNSCEKYLSLKDKVERGTKLEDELNFHRLYVYGCYGFSRDRFSTVYDNHNLIVKEYFKNRKDDFLTINICNGEGWEKLAVFLNKIIPNEPFPYKNTFGEFKKRKTK